MSSSTSLGRSARRRMVSGASFEVALAAAKAFVSWGVAAEVALEEGLACLISLMVVSSVALRCASSRDRVVLGRVTVVAQGGNASCTVTMPLSEKHSSRARERVGEMFGAIAG